MSLIDYSTAVSSRPRRRRRVIIAAAVLCGLSWGGYRLTVRGFAAGAEDTSRMVFATATVANMEITIKHTGELSAVSNQEVRCEVDGQNTIQDIVKEGTFVHKGDVICSLDSSDIRQKLETVTLDFHKAESDLIWAREQVEIQQSKNASDLEAASVALALARLDWREYSEGKYPADLQVARREVEMAIISLKDKKIALEHTRALLEKKFVTAEDEKKALVEELTAQNDLEKKQTALDVLEKYTHEKDETDKQNKVAQAEKTVQHVKTENASNLNQKTADLAAKTKAQEISKYQMDRYTKQMANCTIKAPGDGIMLYGPEQTMYSSDRRIEAGGKVYQNQPIAHLPDVSQMKIVVHLNETEMPGLRSDTKNKMHARVTITGYPQPVWAWVSQIPVVPDNERRWWDPDAKEYTVDLSLDETPKDLKPGASAEAEIFVKHLEKALTVPLDTLYHAGPDAYCFVLNEGKIIPQKVTIGESSRTAAQITQGLQEGQRVLLLGAGQGRDLLDKAGIKAPPTTEPSPQTMPPNAPAVHAA